MAKVDHLKILNADLGKGFTKADLERLIGLPKNILSGVLKNGRPLSKKSLLKIEKWEASEKPNPLEIELEKKTEQVFEDNQEVLDKVTDDILNEGRAIIQTSINDSGEVEVKNVDLVSEEGQKILDELSETEQRIKAIQEKLKLSYKYLPKDKRNVLQRELRILELKLKS